MISYLHKLITHQRSIVETDKFLLNVMTFQDGYMYPLAINCYISGHVLIVLISLISDKRIQTTVHSKVTRQYLFKDILRSWELNSLTSPPDEALSSTK